MRTKYFLLLFLLLLGAGCATSQYGSEATAVLEEGEPSIADTTFLYDSRVIALETKDDALVARVNRLIEWKGNLYILDKAGKQVVAFNMDGKHLFTIHRVGMGPEEYSAVMDVAIDKRKNQLVLLTEPSALLRFDAEGNFIGSRKLPGYYHSIALDGDFIYLENETYANGRLSENSITAIHGEETTGLLEPLIEIAPFCFIAGHQLSASSHVLFTRKFDNTIYKLENQSVSPSYTIDFMNETFPEDAKDKVYDCRDLNKFSTEKGLVYLMTDVTETSEHLLFRTNLFDRLYILSKWDDAVRKYDYIFQSEYGYNLHGYTPVGGEKERICFVAMAGSLMSLKSLVETYPKVKAKTTVKMLELLNRVEEDSNPVLFYYKVK